MSFSMSGGGWNYNRFDEYEKQLLEKKECEKCEGDDCECDDKKKSKGKGGARWQDSDGDGKWYEPGEDVAEGYQRNPEKGEKEDKKYAPVRGEKTPMPPRGNKRREDFEKWYAKNVKEDVDLGLFSDDEVEALEELYKGKHGQSDKEYADSRSDGGKMISGDSKRSGAEFTHGRRVKAENPGMQPDVGGKTKPKSQGKMDKGTRADMLFRKANLKKEELELFSDDEIEALGLGKNEGEIDEAAPLAAIPAVLGKGLAVAGKGALKAGGAAAKGIAKGAGAAAKSAGKAAVSGAKQGAVDGIASSSENKARKMFDSGEEDVEESYIPDHRTSRSKTMGESYSEVYSEGSSVADQLKVSREYFKKRNARSPEEKAAEEKRDAKSRAERGAMHKKPDPYKARAGESD